MNSVERLARGDGSCGEGACVNLCMVGKLVMVMVVMVLDCFDGYTCSCDVVV